MIWRHKSGSTLNSGSGHGLFLDNTKWSKPWHEPMLTNHQGGLVAFTWGWIHRKRSNFPSLIRVWKFKLPVTNFLTWLHLHLQELMNGQKIFKYQYSAMLLQCGQFSSKSLQNTSHSFPIRARYQIWDVFCGFKFSSMLCLSHGIFHIMSYLTTY